MDLIELLQRADCAAGIALDIQGRSQPYLAVVSNNQDPENKRRIKAVSPANPSLETYWIRRLATAPAVDEPLPKVGQTVLVVSIDGVETNQVYIPLCNDTNPPLDKVNPQLDYQRNVEGDYTLNGVKNITITTASGTKIKLDEDGNVSIEGNSLMIDADVEINGDLAIAGSSVSINGKQIATVGAPDSRGDLLTARGW
jgi:phage baseplate assembly protein gpV